MRDELDIVGALSQPLRAFVDPGERVYWVFLLGSLVMPLVVLGVRRGALELRRGLLRAAIWRDPSSRADVTLVFVKAVIAGILRIPWLTATTGAALWVGLSLHRWLGPADMPETHRAIVTAAYTITLFVGWDLGRFLLHLAMHRVRALWCFHQVHHSATVLTPMTLYRTHPVETILVDLRGLVTTAVIAGVFVWLFPGSLRSAEILGVGAIGLLFNAAGANLRHSHVWLSFGRLERWFISPAQHQLHHARDPVVQTHNFGTWLSLWDRLAGTWCRAPQQAPNAYGLADANHRPDSVLSMLVGPFVDLVGRARSRRAAAVTTLGLLLVARTSAAAEPPTPAPVPSESPTETPAPPQRGVDGPDAVPWTGTSAPQDEAPTAAPTGEVTSAARDPPAPVPAPVATPSATPTPPVEDETVRKIVVDSMFDGETLPRVAGSAHVVSQRELERREYDDIHRVLESVPGVYVRGEDGFGLRPNIGLRGANPDRSAKITLTEDGILMGPAPYSAPAAYYFPLATRMVGVEVFKGPAAIKYGPNTIGGAINLRTREIPTTHTSVVDLAGGRYGYFKGHGFYGTTYKGFGVLLEFARVQTQGFKELDGGGDTGFGKNDAMVKLSYESDAAQSVRHRIEAKVGFANEDSDETYLGLTEADFEDRPYRRYRASELDNMKWWRSQAELTYVVRQDDAIEFDVRLYRHDFDRLWRRLDAIRGGPALTDVLANPDAGQTAVLMSIIRGEQDAVLPQQALLVADNDRRFVSQGAQAAFRWRPRWRIVSQDLEIGLRVHNDWIRRHHTHNAYMMTSGEMLPEGTPELDVARNRGDAVAGALHIHDAITLFDRFTIAPGLRIELISMRYDDSLVDERSRRLDVAVSPGIGALVMATRWLGLFAGAHRGFSPVTPGQPEAVKPETSMNYELGARARSHGVFAEAVGFVSDYRNLNAVCTFSSGCIDGDGAAQYNAGAALVWGVESLARFRHGFRRHGLYLELGARYTYTGSRFRESFSSAFPQWGDVEEGFELPYVPEHTAGGTVAFGGRIFEISAAPGYTSAMRDVAGRGAIPDAERIDGFFVMDVSAEVRFLRRLTAYMQLTNVTNNAYVASMRPFGRRPGAPLTFVFGLKARVL